jgi:hypothetical protein
LTSLPILFVIGFYERYFATGKRFHGSTGQVAQRLYQSLPRHLRDIPVLEALVGARTSDLYDAIFEVDVTADADIFTEAPLSRHRAASRESVRSTATSKGNKRPSSAPRTPNFESAPNFESLFSRTRPHLSSLTEVAPQRPLPSAPQTPISKLFNKFGNGDRASAVGVGESVRRLETLVGEMQDSIIANQNLRVEMQEMQNRQQRIEALLLQLVSGKQ